MADKLTIKELKFIEEYMNSNSIGASMTAAGYSAKTASVCGNKMLKKPKIAAEVAKRKADLAKKYSWSREEAIEALKAIHKEAPKHSDKVAAIKELNTVMGHHEPQKIEHSGLIQSIQRTIIDPKKAA